MEPKKQPIKIGLDYVRDEHGAVKEMTRKGALRYGYRTMPQSLKDLGFQVHIFDASEFDMGDYFRINFGKVNK